MTCFERMRALGYSPQEARERCGRTWLERLAEGAYDLAMCVGCYLFLLPYFWITERL